MRLTPESRLLLAVAGRIVPPERREEWAREWEGELWYWLTSTPDAAAFSARLELARHCSGAVLDAFYLRFDREELAQTAGRILGHPGLPVLAALVSLLILGLGSGWLARTRLAFGRPAYPGSGRIAILSQTMPYRGQPVGIPPAQLALWERESRTVQNAAVYIWYRTVSGAPLKELPAVKVGAGFFRILSSAALLGRLFQPSDATGCRDCAVLSYDYWSHGLDRDPGIIGRTILVDGGPARVIGVLPRDFWFLDAPPAVWTLYIPGETWREWPEPMAGAICRLPPGATTAAAQRELRAMAAGAVQSGIAPVTVVPVASALLRPVGGFLAVFGSFFAVAAVFSIAGGGARRTAFGILTSTLALAIVFLAALEFTDPTHPLAIWALLAVSTVVLYGCVRDQRARCRVCLHRLTMPVRIGHAGQVLLDPAGTELICPRGHGMLYTPEMPAEPDCWVRASL